MPNKQQTQLDPEELLNALAELQFLRSLGLAGSSSGFGGGSLADILGAEIPGLGRPGFERFLDPFAIGRNAVPSFAPQGGPIQFLGGSLTDPEPAATIAALGALIQNAAEARRVEGLRRQSGSPGKRSQQRGRGPAVLLGPGRAGSL